MKNWNFKTQTKWPLQLPQERPPPEAAAPKLSCRPPTPSIGNPSESFPSCPQKIMSDIEDVLVLSDVHLAAERDRGLFRADGEMSAFLDWIITDAGPSRVVIAGDFLDFLVPMDGETNLAYFDPNGAHSRATSIVEHHEEVFDALARLANSNAHELWIASGNHDPELLFPDVREVMDRRTRRGSRAGVVRWCVDGEAMRFRTGDASILITHGDAFDDWNRVNHGALRRAANRISYGFSKDSEWEYEPPPGTRIVIDYLVRLRAKYPWVDTLKPERDAVFPILHEFLDYGEHWKYRGLIARAIKMAGESWLHEAIRHVHPETLIRRSDEEGSLRQRLTRWLALEDAGVPLDLISTLRDVSEADGYFDIFAPDEFAELLPHFFKRGADLLVAGHTHAAKAHLVEDRNLYLNTGTWARLLQLPPSGASDETWSNFVERLHEGCDLGEPRPTFAWIRKRDDGSTQADLMSWERGIAVRKVAFRFLPNDRRWVSEVENG
jgi:UDP-2,3-diacylglucosamine pyrophosphatase LpxH